MFKKFSSDEVTPSLIVAGGTTRDEGVLSAT